MIRKSANEIYDNPLVRSIQGLGLALSSAGLMLLTMPPFDLWPLAFMALVPLYLAIREASVTRAAFLGWLCGWVVNIGGVFWGVEVLEQFAQLSKGISLVSVLGVCAYQGAVWLIWALVCNLFCRYLRLSWLLVAPLFLAILEAAVLMIFPWNLGFMVWRAWPILQIAELGGPPAVSALLVLINILGAEALGRLFGRRPLSVSIKWSACVVAMVISLGLVRAVHVDIIRSNMPIMKIGIVQPNFGIMSMKSRNRHGQEFIEVQRHVTKELEKQGVDLVIWPESAIPFLFDPGLECGDAPGHPRELRDGGNVRWIFRVLEHPFGNTPIYNRSVMVGTSGRSPDWPEIETGQGPQVLKDDNFLLAPFIYYEDIFMGFNNQVALKRPNLLVTLATPPWFGDTTAPQLALALATLRSVETRRDLVRATNTGVSSIGDALGRIHKESPLFHVSPVAYAEPTLLVGEVALMQNFSLGPYTTPFFPYGCILCLAIVTGINASRILRRP